MTEDKNVVSSTRRRLNEQKKLRRGVRENETKSYREREREKEGGRDQRMATLRGYSAKGEHFYLYSRGQQRTAH